MSETKERRATAMLLQYRERFVFDLFIKMYSSLIN